METTDPDTLTRPQRQLIAAELRGMLADMANAHEHWTARAEAAADDSPSQLIARGRAMQCDAFEQSIASRLAELEGE